MRLNASRSAARMMVARATVSANGRYHCRVVQVSAAIGGLTPRGTMSMGMPSGANKGGQEISLAKIQFLNRK